MSESDLSYIHPQLRPLAISIADLVPDPANARKHDAKNMSAITESLQRFGMRQPIVVQRKNGELIVRAGNGRMQAAISLGWTHLPATIFDEDDDDAVAYAIADNRTAELAEWDFEVLGKHLTDLLEDSIDLTAEKIGFSEEEVGALTERNLWSELPDAFDLPSNDAPGPGPGKGSMSTFKVQMNTDDCREVKSLFEFIARNYPSPGDALLDIMRNAETP